MSPHAKPADENVGVRDGTLGYEPFVDTQPTARSLWDPPVPLDAGVALPPFPTPVLPAWLARFVEALAEATQTPLDLAGTLVLAAVSLALAKRVKVEPRAGWLEPVNLYVVVALEPGNRKSAVFQRVVAPVVAFERDVIAEAAPVIQTARTRLDLAQEHAKRAVAAAARANGAERSKLEDEAIRAGNEVGSIEVPVEPRLLADDATPEVLVTLLRDQGGRIGALSPEGGLFSILAGRYSSKGEPNLDAILKAHAGDSIRVDRINRPAEFVREPALVLGLAVQPAVIASLAREKSFRGRGLLARILFSLPVSPMGRRKIPAPPVPEDVEHSYNANMGALLRIPSGRDDQGELVARVLAFETGALEELMAFERILEPRLGPGGDLVHIQDWAAKAAGLVVRLAALLHESSRIGRPHAPVARETVAGAVALGRYALAHALAAFGLMRADEELEDARHVLEWIRRGNREAFSLRDAFEGTKGRFKRTDPLKAALGVLVDRGFVRLAVADPRLGPGRPRSPRYDVNPCLSESGSHNSQNGHPSGSAISAISAKADQ